MGTKTLLTLVAAAIMSLSCAKKESVEDEWQPLYSNTFCSNPEWKTNNPSRFNFSLDEGVYNVESHQGAEEYAFYEIPKNTNSIKLGFDIKILKGEWGSHVGVGIYDKDMSVKGNFIEAHFGWDDWGKEACLYLNSTVGQRYKMHYGDYKLDTWYHFELVYDKPSKSATLKVKERASGNPFCKINVNKIEDFTGLSRIGFSNVGTTPYKTTFKSKIDNVSCHTK